MSGISELDGAKVIKHTPNEGSEKLSMMFFEEEDGTVAEIEITALAIAKYENEKDYYVFMCDKDWTIQDEQQLESVDQAMEWADKNFDLTGTEWIG